MQLKMMSRLMAAALLSVLSGCQGEEPTSTEGEVAAQEAGAKTQCMTRFDGITSCALGNAQLSATDKGLNVTGLRSARTDGVSSSFGRAARWSQTTSVALGSTGQLQLEARSGDQVVSTLRVTPGRDVDSAFVTPTFTGSPGGSGFRMNIYREGVLQGTSTHSPNAMIVFTNWRDFFRWLVAVADFYELDIIWTKTGEATAESNVGACGWQMTTPGNTFSVTLADGKVVTGDSFEFVEEIGDGHYPYNGFTGMDVKATGKGLSILSETFVPAAK
ncbi:hypothetical protein OWM54_07115 [Myxococcus sp. MISCRS1]|jgi:hypothetical protein|uniref:hypothetical protein n=1 Tax=Myxococcus TaxID=32 RepID=UPI001CBAE286|nr:MULTISPECIES: hypothetical protein [unclassified Myxococcus]MBZ4400762.1 hypothetical protein [Myxococcus sp. AS-1-15]MBZ4413989.1 hypothetical protein [Myxococcus sp. XM-1-1-1]MCY0996910.1 hypothetical protein [Myxococcus sp. MISCRS1]BDT33078.1 hypothetical protein MFMH1_27470 [Myxococcus sp. MH1]